MDAHVHMHPNPRSIARLRLAATAAALTAAAIGAVALLGWAVGSDGIKGVVDMKANAAILLLLLGVALAVSERLGSHQAAQAAVRALAFAVLALAAVIASQFLSGREIGIDELLFADPEAVPPGRIALNTSICFMLVALAVLSAQGRDRAALPPVAGLAVAAAGMLALIGHFTGVQDLYGIVGATQMASASAVSVVLLGAALICSRPESGFMRLLTSTGMGGAMVRRVLPLAVGGVALLAILRNAGQRADLWSPEVGTWLFASSCAVLIIQVIWRAAWFLERTDSQRRELAEQMRELAERDPLTHLFNRRRFDEALIHQLAIARRYGGAFSVLMLDLDHFKQVNDTQGHPAGDRLLKNVARTLDTSLRASDIVARFGGDEFVALLPHTDLEACQAVAAKLHELLRVRGIQISIGAVVCDPPLAPGLRPETILSRADGALYVVKARGGDNVSVQPLSLVAPAA